jgi:hypothetical protein
VTLQHGGGGGIERPAASSLADVVDTILDKGLVIDAYVRVSLLGIELLTVEARVVVASVDTYLQFAEAVTRLNLAEDQGKRSAGTLLGETAGSLLGKPAGSLLGGVGRLVEGDGDREPTGREKRR